MRLALSLLAAVLVAAALPGPASATDSPLSGEALLGRDVEVRAGPSAGAPALRALPRGTVVTSLGSPRGTGFAEIGIGGRPAGYVPVDALASIYGPREVSGAVALLSRRLVAPDGGLDASHVLRRPVAAAEARDGKRRQTRLPAGTPVALLDVADGKARVAADGTAGAAVEPDALLPIAGVHGGEPGRGEPRGHYLARVGEHASPAEAEAAWQALLRAAPHLGVHGRFVYPVLGPGLRFALAFGPMDRAGADSACLSLAQRQTDCWITELLAY
jgi:hypothetical protein